MGDGRKLAAEPKVDDEMLGLQRGGERPGKTADKDQMKERVVCHKT